MKNVPVMVAKVLTTFLLLSVAPGVHAQPQLTSQPSKTTDQARLRARLPVVAPRYRVPQNKAVIAPTRSILQTVPAQLSTAHRPIAGQRQTATSLVPANSPLERVYARIETRVQSRLVSRLDKSGEAPPVLSPFATAADRARVAATRRR